MKSFEPSCQADLTTPIADRSAGARGSLIVNADDWGRDRDTTNHILGCARHGTVSAASAMVFMDDSERSAALAAEHRIETGLHLNFTTPYSARMCPTALRDRQEQVGRYLLKHRLAQVMFHPGLATSFEYLVAAQLEEYRRIYGTSPERVDGHHHMHLSANVLLQQLLPAGAIVRRSFHFERGEKSALNRFYRKVVDHTLAQRHRLTDYFFSIEPLADSRVLKIYSLAQQHVVELETHPAVADEHRYLMGSEMFRHLGDVRIMRPSAVTWTHAPQKDAL
ncbi:MAG: Chitooligosaccharide deacetylase [Bryobacteraceae bacterium]|nr:Chitooligosaccharide deacetylase [Bryobacteraceae bacterium]